MRLVVNAKFDCISSQSTRVFDALAKITRRRIRKMLSEVEPMSRILKVTMNSEARVKLSTFGQWQSHRAANSQEKVRTFH